MPKEFDCKLCDTMIRSSIDDELVRDQRYHMKAYHKQRVSKEEALKNLKPVAS